MQSLALSHIYGNEEEFRTLPSALHFRSGIFLAKCEGVDPIVQQESLIFERAVSPFLALFGKGVLSYEDDGI